MASIVKTLIAAFIGAIVAGVLSLIPFLNYLCCLPIVVGGFTAGALLGVMGKGEKLEITDGLLSGALSGVIIGLTLLVAMVIFALGFGGLYLGLGALFALAERNLAPLLVFGGMGAFASIIIAVVGVVVSIVYVAIYGVMGSIGGAIAGALLYKKG